MKEKLVVTYVEEDSHYGVEKVAILFTADDVEAVINALKSGERDVTKNAYQFTTRLYNPILRIYEDINALCEERLNHVKSQVMESGYACIYLDDTHASTDYAYIEIEKVNHY